MLQPINYELGGLNPIETAVKGYQEGIQQRQQREKQAEFEALDWNNHDALRQYAAKNPKFGEGVNKYLSGLEERHQKKYIGDTHKGIALIKNGKGSVFAQDMRAKEQAFYESGDRENAKHYGYIARMAEDNPQSALQMLQMQMISADPKFGASYKAYAEATNPELVKLDTGNQLIGVNRDPITGKMDDNPLYRENKKVSPDVEYKANNDYKIHDLDNQADITQENIKAGVSMHNNAQNNATDNRGLDIKQAQLSVDRQIAQAELQLKHSKNDIEREKLQVELGNLKFKQKQYAQGLSQKQVEQNVKRQEKMQGYQNTMDGLDTTMATINRLLDNDGGFWGGLNSAVGSVDSKFPTFLPNTVAFEKDLEVLKSQVFLSQVSMLKGTGAITDTEGAKLENSIASLSINTDAPTMRRNITLIKDFMYRAKKRTEKKQATFIEHVKKPTGTTAGRLYLD